MSIDTCESFADNMRMIRNNSKLILIKHGIKPSEQRIAVLSVCMQSTIPLDVARVSDRLSGRVHLATIYRTLEKFVQLGILTKIDFQEGKFRYEYVAHHHHHAVCQVCGKIEDVVDELFEKIGHKNLRKSGFYITKHTLELFGICNNCQKTNNKGEL